MRRLRLKTFALLAFFLGGCWRLKEYRVWMPLKGYRVDAQSPVLEERLWDLFPSRSAAFWPWLLRDSEALGEFLERDIPVVVSTKMSRFGRFETTLQWLTPWVKVEWQGQIWCLSKEGRMWDAAMRLAPELDAAVKGPVWHLARFAGGPQAPPAGVFDSPFSVEVITGFLDKYQGCSWFDAVREIVWDRRAGMDLFRMRMEREGQVLEVLLQSAKYAGQDLGAALEDVFARLSREGGNHRVDATYEGKILVRALPGGPKEGSRE